MLPVVSRRKVKRFISTLLLYTLRYTQNIDSYLSDDKQGKRDDDGWQPEDSTQTQGLQSHF